MTGISLRIAVVSVGLLCVAPAVASASERTNGLDDDVTRVIYGDNYDNGATIGDSDYVAAGGIDPEVEVATGLLPYQSEIAADEQTAAPTQADGRILVAGYVAKKVVESPTAQRVLAGAAVRAAPLYFLYLGGYVLRGWIAPNYVCEGPECGSGGGTDGDTYVIDPSGEPSDYVLTDRDLETQPTPAVASGSTVASTARFKGPPRDDDCIALCWSIYEALGVSTKWVPIGGTVEPNRPNRTRIDQLIRDFGGSERAAKCREPIERLMMDSDDVSPFEQSSPSYQNGVAIACLWEIG